MSARYHVDIYWCWYLRDLWQMSVMHSSFESSQSEICSFHMVADHNFGLKHCQEFTLKSRLIIISLGPSQFWPLGRPLGHFWGNHDVLCATSEKPVEKTWIWSQNIENDSKPETRCWSTSAQLIEQMGAMVIRYNIWGSISSTFFAKTCGSLDV